MVDITRQERRAIQELQDVAANWPNSLWLLSCQGGLYIIKKNEDGEPAYLPIVPGEARKLDPEYIVAAVAGIDNDGSSEDIV